MTDQPQPDLFDDFSMFEEGQPITDLNRRPRERQIVLPTRSVPELMRREQNPDRRVSRKSSRNRAARGGASGC